MTAAKKKKTGDGKSLGTPLSYETVLPILERASAAERAVLLHLLPLGALSTMLLTLAELRDDADCLEEAARMGPYEHHLIPAASELSLKASKWLAVPRAVMAKECSRKGKLYA